MAEAGLLDDAALRRAAATENFPVALRLLPRPFRDDLSAVYGVARTIDDIGDNPAHGSAEDRLGLLDRYAADLSRIWRGESPEYAANQRLAPVARRTHLDEHPFQALVDANRQDQTTASYRTWDDLRDYCRRSADPVGRIVLQLTGSLTTERAAWSDDVCTALQLLEHCQDVAEDRRAGRVYLPEVDRTRFGVTPDQLDARRTTTGLRGLVGFEVNRARALLESGTPLVGSLHGAARVAVAGFVAGGRATADGLARDSFDVMAIESAPRKRDVARRAVMLLAGRS